MERLFVVPAKENSIIRYPGSDRILAIVGGYVPKTQYWTRRVADKDVLDCTAQEQVEDHTPLKSAKSKEEVKQTPPREEVIPEVKDEERDTDKNSVKKEVKKPILNKKKKVTKK